MEFDTTNQCVREVWTKDEATEDEATKKTSCIDTKQPEKPESNACTTTGQKRPELIPMSKMGLS